MLCIKINKQILIDNGEIPYLKAEAEANTTGDYKGVPWIVNFPIAPNVYFQWFKSWASCKYFPIIRDYRFRPSKGNRGNSPVEKLTTLKREHGMEFVLEKYTRTPNKSYYAKYYERKKLEALEQEEKRKAEEKEDILFDFTQDDDEIEQQLLKLKELA